MGALFGIGIDNVLVEIDNEEVPILDGSAKFFIEKILSSGLESSNKPIKIIKINKKIEFKNGEKETLKAIRANLALQLFGENIFNRIKNQEDIFIDKAIKTLDTL